MRTYNKQFETAKVLNTSFNGLPLQLDDVFGYSIQCVISGTPTGTLSLQLSSDGPGLFGQPPAVPTDWTDVPNSSFTVSAAGDVMWEVAGSGTPWVRIVYVDGSSGASTATMNARINAKGF